jgi:hypothetical protein
MDIPVRKTKDPKKWGKVKIFPKMMKEIEIAIAFLTDSTDVATKLSVILINVITAIPAT